MPAGSSVATGLPVRSVIYHLQLAAVHAQHKVVCQLTIDTIVTNKPILADDVPEAYYPGSPGNRLVEKAFA